MRVIALTLVLWVSPTIGAAQASSNVAYQPNPTAAKLNAEVLATPQDTVVVDQYAVDNTVAYGAAVGGIIGGLAVAVHTLSENDRDPVSWGAAVAAPVLGGLIGAGIGYLIR